MALGIISGIVAVGTAVGKVVAGALGNIAIRAKIIELVKVFCELVVLILQNKLGMDKDTKMEDLSVKSIQAEKEGVKPENFKSYKEYLEEINKREIDPVKAKEIPEDDKIKKMAEIAASVFKEVNPNMQVERMFKYFEGNNSYLTPERMKIVGDIGLTNEKMAEAILDYLTGGVMNTNSKLEAEEYLQELEKRMPESTLNMDDVVKYASAEREINVSK